MSFTSTAVNAQGAKLQIASGSGSAQAVTAVAVGFPTILTGVGINAGDVITLAAFTGADAALLNGVTTVAKYVANGKYAVDIDTTGKTITVSSSTATPNTYTRVANLKDFNGFDGAASDIDITHLESAAKEFRAGLVDNGQVSCNVQQDLADAGQIAVMAAQVASATKNFKVTLSSGKVASFAGYIKKFSAAGQVDGVIMSSLDIKITGSVTWA
jgi:hypothetical protein